MLARQVTFPAPPNQANSFPAMLLRTLCAKCAAPAPSSLFQLRTKRTKNTPVSPLSTAFTPNRSLTPLESTFTKNTGGVGVTGPFAFPPALTLMAQPKNRAPLSIFRMNTRKSVTKQTTLTFFRMNTYAKTGGGSPPRTDHTGTSLPTTHHPLPTFFPIRLHFFDRLAASSCFVCKHFAPKCAQPCGSRYRSSSPRLAG